jgi:acetolactate synthase-1/2/3 large subunit
MHTLLKYLRESKKPVIVAGGGIRLSNAKDDLIDCVHKLKIPVVVPMMGFDLFTWDNPSYLGHGGNKGQRSANMIIEKADLIISIGSRLSICFIGHDFKKWGINAKKVVCDIDENEHKKRTIKIDLFIKSDAKKFIKRLVESKYICSSEWIKEYQDIKKEHFTFKGVGMYKAIEKISRLSKPNDTFIFDAGITIYICAQTIKIKKDQRAIIPGATLSMGYNLPAIIGVWATKPKGDIICITGDGSFQLNIQELQTIVYHKIPAKIFVTNNNGYQAIRTTQRNFFKRFIGESKDSGISFPSLKKIAFAYGIKYTKSIKFAMNYKDTIICEIECPFWQDML